MLRKEVPNLLKRSDFVAWLGLFGWLFLFFLKSRHEFLAHKEEHNGEND